MLPATRLCTHAGINKHVLFYDFTGSTRDKQYCNVLMQSSLGSAKPGRVEPHLPRFAKMTSVIIQDMALRRFDFCATLAAIDRNVSTCVLSHLHPSACWPLL